MSWHRFNSQFRETEWERQQRWKKTRARRTAEGKCWQCAALIAECTCPNVKHNISHSSLPTPPATKPGDVPEGPQSPASPGANPHGEQP